MCTIVNLKPADGRLTELLKSEVAKAKRLAQKPFVEFYADWCGPCRALRSSLDDPRMKDAFRGTYVIQLDADAWKPGLAGTGFSVNAVPVFYELDDPIPAPVPAARTEHDGIGRASRRGARGDDVAAAAWPRSAS